MRVVLHTWFHAGEINAVSQMHGHPAISVVGPTVGKLEWHSEDQRRRAPSRDSSEGIYSQAWMKGRPPQTGLHCGHGWG